MYTPAAGGGARQRGVVLCHPFGQEYLRARLVTGGDGARVALYPNQSSGVLSSVAWADCLVVVPPGTTVARGDPVRRNSGSKHSGANEPNRTQGVAAMLSQKRVPRLRAAPG